MATTAETQSVLKAIEDHEGPDADGGYTCNNDVLREATGLDADIVAEVLRDLWRSDQIEGVQTMAGGNPYLQGIRRVLLSRERTWGGDGRYTG